MCKRVHSIGILAIWKLLLSICLNEHQNEGTRRCTATAYIFQAFSSNVCFSLQFLNNHDMQRNDSDDVTIRQAESLSLSHSVEK